MAAPPVTALDLDDIQALAVTSWKRLQHAAYLFVTFRAGPDAAAHRRWLAGVTEQVSRASQVPARDVDATAEATGHGGPPRLQLALSAAGMVAVGATDAEMRGFSDEAIQGMAARARILGDGEDPASARWELGALGAPRIGALIACYADDATTLEQMITRQTAAADAIGASVVVERMHFIGKREHFGYADGISQPLIAGTRPGADPTHEVPAGEILLGYENAYGHLPRVPRRGDVDLGRNGSYLVIRKLEQDVIAFWSFFQQEATRLLGCGYGPGPGCTAAQLDAWIDWLAAKVVGRWRSGASLVTAPDQDEPAKANPDVVNRFDYRDLDPHGERCPIGSHVRRANPRDARDGTAEESRLVVGRHRLLRRGRSWGPAITRDQVLAGVRDPHRRGLMFICLQASIARGFEFVQQTWLSNLGFGGLSREGDPIMGGEVDPRGEPHASFTIPLSPVRIRLHGIPRFVRTLGGEYFFMPSLTALRVLAGA